MGLMDKINKNVKKGVDLANKAIDDEKERNKKFKEQKKEERAKLKRQKQLKALVKQLVGTGLVISPKLRDDLPNTSFDKLIQIQKKIKESWKNGASSEEIQELYDKTVSWYKVGDSIKQKNKVIEKENKVQAKVDKIKNEIRQGIKIAVIKMVEGEKSKHSDFVKGVSSLGWGIAGYAITSGKEFGVHETFVESVLKVVPKGLVVSTESESDMRIPNAKIIKSNYEITMRGKKFSIQLVGGEYLNLITKYNHAEELNTIINSSARGVEDTGWE